MERHQSLTGVLRAQSSWLRTETKGMKSCECPCELFTKATKVSYFLNKIPPNYKWSKTFLLYGIVVDFDDKNAARELVKVVVIKEWNNLQLFFPDASHMRKNRNRSVGNFSILSCHHQAFRNESSHLNPGAASAAVARGRGKIRFIDLQDCLWLQLLK